MQTKDFYTNYLDWDSLVVGGVDTRDYPDFVDSYIEYAEWSDGSELTSDQLDQLNDYFPEVVQELAMESLV